MHQSCLSLHMGSLSENDRLILKNTIVVTAVGGSIDILNVVRLSIWISMYYNWSNVKENLS